MEVIHPRVAGIDVHKKIVWVAVRLPGQRPAERTVTAKRFKTFWRSLRQMAAWLAELGVTDAAMESTGVYWWPVYHALAQAGIEVCVCNAAHMRNVPGRKRDVADCQQLARAARARAAAAQLHPGRRGGRAAGPDPVPQEADRAAHQRGPAAGQGAGGRRHQDRPRWPPGCCSSPGGR